MKGRPKKPMSIKIAEGNRRQRGKAELMPDAPGIGRPSLPPSIEGEAARLWVKVVASLPDGLLTRADEATLEAFAGAWATYREADAKIQKTGLLVQSPQGPIRNPLLVVRNHACQHIISLGAVLGMSPVARARLAAPNSADSDPMALLLGDDGDPNGAWSTLKATKQ
jgi:P27 family predicted phage terminase small subunit